MNTEGPRLYRLDGIEVDGSRLCLTRDGEERHLRQQTFQVLIYLLEQRERLITKDELIEHVWRNTAVTDNALEQCLAEIRKVLGDDSRNPRFIKTVPRAGYRFIGSVEEIDRDQLVTAERERARETVTDAPAKTERPAKMALWFTRREVLALSAVLVIAVAIIATYYIRNRSTSGGPELPQDPSKRAVAVMFFDNQSGSADLDWLREGLADMIITGLSRSKHITVLSRQQLHVLLDRVGHRESEKIRLGEALEIARQSQAKILVLGSFARLGEQIRIDVHLHDGRDGQLLSAERMVVDQAGQILTQVDLLSLKLASYIGAPAGDEAKADLSSVMTNDLEAYRYYSLGVEKSQALHNTEAIALFEKALALDPEFAMAHAGIGYAHAVSWNLVDEGKPYLEKAFKLTNRLSEKDRLNIAAWYALANLDYSGAIKAFQEIVARYPLEVDAYRRLGNLLRGEERFDEAIEVMKQGLVIDAGAKELYNSLGLAYSEAGRHDEAIAMFQRYVALAPDEANAHDSLGGGYQWAGRYQEAIQAYERARALKPDFEIPVIHLANTHFQQGRYREAIKHCEEYIQLAPAALERARGYMSISYVQRARNRHADAERAASRAMKYHERGAGQMALVALEKGDLTAAEKFIRTFESRRTGNRGSRADLRELYYFQGLLALKKGKTTEGIDFFKQAIKHRPPTWHIHAFEDCLANAYLELGRFDEAIAEYQRILKLNPNYPLVHYHLAQAYERKGQRDQARAEYARFLQVWKDADADVPEVISAKKALSG